MVFPRFASFSFQYGCFFRNYAGKDAAVCDGMTNQGKDKMNIALSNVRVFLPIHP
jgi:hypothetical protein